MRSRVLAAVLLAGTVLATGCGEPAVDLEVPPRSDGEHVLDPAGVLGAEVEAAVANASERTGVDIVALAFEDAAATLGQADRGGRRLLDAWDADVVLVAVARPGHFQRPAPDRERFFGVYSADRFAVPRALREAVVDDIVPPLAADNRWPEAFTVAVEALERGLPRGGR